MEKGWPEFVVFIGVKEDKIGKAKTHCTVHLYFRRDTSFTLFHSERESLLQVHVSISETKIYNTPTVSLPHVSPVCHSQSDKVLLNRPVLALDITNWFE